MKLWDDIDLKIWKYLQRDGRATYAEIGKEVELHETTVRARIAQMHQKGLIRRIAALPNPQKWNLSALALVQIKPSKGRPIGKILEKLEKENVIYLLEISDEFPILLVVYKSTFEEIIRFVETLKGVEEIDSIKATPIVKEHIPPFDMVISP